MEEGSDCFLYFCNTGYCTEDIAILRRIASYFESEHGGDFGLNETDGFSSVVSKLATGMSKIVLGGAVFVFVDAIEQLESARNLWLSISSICEQNSLVACMLTGTQSLAGDDELVLLGLEETQVEGIINRELTDTGRTLRTPLLDKIMSCDIARNPVALRGILNELFVAGKYDELDVFVDKLCAISDVPSLFDSVLERVIDDVSALCFSPEGIKRATVFLANVHYGASEDEIMAVSGLLPLGWAMLRAALSSFLVSFDGRIRFNHQLAEDAVRKRQGMETLTAVVAAALEEYAAPPRSIARIVELSGWAYLSDDDRVISSVIFDPGVYPILVDCDEDGLRRSLGRLSRNEGSASNYLAQLVRGRAADSSFLLELCRLLSKTGCVRSCISQVDFAQAQGCASADMLTLKARAIYQRGDYANVQGAFEEALRAMSAEHRCDTPSYALLMLQYGIAEKSRGRGQSALAKVREACAVFDHLELISSDSLWCQMYRATLEFLYARGVGPDTFSEILAGQKLLSGEKSYAYSRLLCYSWQSFLLAGDYEAADAMTKQSLEGLSRTSGEGPDRAWALTNRATVLACLGKRAESKMCSIESDRLNGQTATGDMHVYSITSHMNRILLDYAERLESGDEENAASEAIGNLERLRVIAMRFHERSHPYVLNIEANKAILSAAESVDELCDVSRRMTRALEGDNCDSLYLDTCAWALGGDIDKELLVGRYKSLGVTDCVTEELLGGCRGTEFRLVVNNGAALYLVPSFAR